MAGVGADLSERGEWDPRFPIGLRALQAGNDPAQRRTLAPQHDQPDRRLDLAYPTLPARPMRARTRSFPSRPATRSTRRRALATAIRARCLALAPGRRARRMPTTKQPALPTMPWVA